jgi:hypothetical protein
MQKHPAALFAVQGALGMLVVLLLKVAQEVNALIDMVPARVFNLILASCMRMGGGVLPCAL